MVKVALIVLCTFVSLFFLVCDDLLQNYYCINPLSQRTKIVFSKQMTKENSSSPVVALHLWQSSQPGSLGRCLFFLLYCLFQNKHQAFVAVMIFKYISASRCQCLSRETKPIKLNKMKQIGIRIGDKMKSCIHL